MNQIKAEMKASKGGSFAVFTKGLRGFQIKVADKKPRTVVPRAQGILARTTAYSDLSLDLSDDPTFSRIDCETYRGGEFDSWLVSQSEANAFLGQGFSGIAGLGRKGDTPTTMNEVSEALAQMGFSTDIGSSPACTQPIEATLGRRKQSQCLSL